jgi:predicted dehydrogenase
MLERERPDLVSICTWPHLHAEMAIAAAAAGARAIHCEKPMATTWGEARRMADACAARGAQLTFNHQRRLLGPFQAARRLLREGAIGSLRRIEGACGDLIDWGTHWLDMFFFYNEETPAEWVIGQIDLRRGRTIFGLAVEDQAVCHFRFRNGVTGLLVTGAEADIGCANRLVGSEGTLEVHADAPHVRLRGKGDADWRAVGTSEGIHGEIGITRGIADLLAALEAGREPELAARRALQATEVIFATYESSRRRGRVDLPLEIDDSPLLAMLQSGELRAASGGGTGEE